MNMSHVKRQPIKLLINKLDRLNYYKDRLWQIIGTLINKTSLSFLRDPLSRIYSGRWSQDMQYRPPLTDNNIIDGLSVGYLKIFGFWKIINEYRTTGKRNAFINFQFIMTFLVSFPYIACQFFSYFAVEMDIQKATIINIHCLPAIIMCSRIMVFWIRMDSQCKLYNLLQKDFLHIPDHKTVQASKIYRKITDHANFLCILAFLVDFSVFFGSVFIPGIPVDYILHHKGSMFDVKTGKKKILSSWYPLPMAESPYYEIIFVYEVIGVFLGSLLNPIYVCMFYQALVALHAQFEVLSYHVSTVNITCSNPDCTETNYNSNFDFKSKIVKECTDCSIKKEFYTILHDHQRLLSYAEELRSVYNPLVTMMLGIAVCFIIVSVFQYHMGETGDLMFVFKGLQLLTSQMVELAMFCFGSTSLKTASSDLQLAVYSSDWYKADVSLRKTAQMMMIGAKKGVCLTAIKMYPVNKETVMSIVRFAYSTSALMSGMLGK